MGSSGIVEKIQYGGSRELLLAMALLGNENSNIFNLSGFVALEADNSV